MDRCSGTNWRRIMVTPDYCRKLLKQSRAKASCLCIHHDTRVEFGGWAKCANTAIPPGRIHAVKSTYLSDCSKSVGANVDSGSQQKASNVTSTKAAQRIAVFRRKADRKAEEECLRFCHLGNTSDHIRNYREMKYGLIVEKTPRNYRAGPSTRLMQVKGNFHDVSFPDIEDGVNRPDSNEKLTTIHKVSKFHRVPLVTHSYAHSNNSDYSPNLRGSQLQSVSVLVDSGPGRPQVIGRTVPVVFSEAELLTKKYSNKGSRDSIGSLAQMTRSEQQAEFTAWVPENAIYQSRSSSAKTYINHSTPGYQSRTATKDTQQSNATFQPLQLHTNHLKKSKYPPSLLFHEKQEDQIMVKSSRSKDGKVHTRIEFFSMTVPEQQQQSVAKKERRVRYLEPLTMVDSERKVSDKNSRRGEDHLRDGDPMEYSEAENPHQKQSHSGRLLSGRINSGRQQITEEDLRQLTIGKQLASEDDNAMYSQYVSRRNGRNRGRRRFYHIEKHDSTCSIPSKSIAQSNLCDLQIQPSLSSSALIQYQDNSSDVTVSSSSSTHHNSQRIIRDSEGILEDRHQLNTQECANEFVVNCPTVVNRSLLASPHKPRSGANESDRAISSVDRHTMTYPHLRKSGHRKGIHLNSQVNSHSKMAIFNSHTVTERFLPSSKHHGRIVNLSHAVTEKSREQEPTNTGYRVTLSGSSSNSPNNIHHQVGNSSRCMLRSRQRRKVQLQRNILGNLSSSSKKMEQNSNAVLRAYKKAHQPVKVCLRGTKKKLIDLLRTNSSNSVLDDSSELPELYAE